MCPQRFHSFFAEFESCLTWLLFFKYCIIVSPYFCCTSTGKIVIRIIKKPQIPKPKCPTPKKYLTTIMYQGDAYIISRVRISSITHGIFSRETFFNTSHTREKPSERSAAGQYPNPSFSLLRSVIIYERARPAAEWYINVFVDKPKMQSSGGESHTLLFKCPRCEPV